MDLGYGRRCERFRVDIGDALWNFGSKFIKVNWGDRVPKRGQVAREFTSKYVGSVTYELTDFHICWT